MPVGGAEAEMITHGFVADDFISIIVAEGEGVGGAGTLVLEGRDVGEVFGHGVDGSWLLVPCSWLGAITALR